MGWSGLQSPKAGKTRLAQRYSGGDSVRPAQVQTSQRARNLVVCAKNIPPRGVLNPPQPLPQGRLGKLAPAKAARCFFFAISRSDPVWRDCGLIRPAPWLREQLERLRREKERQQEEALEAQVQKLVECSQEHSLPRDPSQAEDFIVSKMQSLLGCAAMPPPPPLMPNPKPPDLEPPGAQHLQGWTLTRCKSAMVRTPAWPRDCGRGRCGNGCTESACVRSLSRV